MITQVLIRNSLAAGLLSGIAGYLENKYRTDRFSKQETKVDQIRQSILTPANDETSTPSSRYNPYDSILKFGSGNPTTKDYNHLITPKIKKINTSCVGSFKIETGTAESSFTIKTDENLHPGIKPRMDGDTLSLNLDFTRIMVPVTRIEFQIRVPQSIETYSGYGQIEMQNLKSGGTVVSGTGTFEINLGTHPGP